MNPISKVFQCWFDGWKKDMAAAIDSDLNERNESSRRRIFHLFWIFKYPDSIREVKYIEFKTTNKIQQTKWGRSVHLEWEFVFLRISSKSSQYIFRNGWFNGHCRYIIDRSTQQRIDRFLVSFKMLFADEIVLFNRLVLKLKNEGNLDFPFDLNQLYRLNKPFVSHVDHVFSTRAKPTMARRKNRRFVLFLQIIYLLAERRTVNKLTIDFFGLFFG